LLAIVLAAVALNVAVLAPAATVTDAGTVSKVLLLDSVTLDPPVGAEAFKATVQFAAALGLRLPGLQVRDESVGTVMVPFVPAVTGRLSPVASTPYRLDTEIAVVSVEGASVA
jgi:hypothetical protein